MADSAPLTSTVTSEDPDAFTVATTPRLGKPWHLSDEGLSFLGVLESGVLNGTNWQGYTVTDGFILTVYDDGYGNPTVGLGHLVVPSDNLKMKDTITIEQARAFARIDFAKAVNAVNRRVMVPLHQYEFDALVSVAFNAGAGDGFSDVADQINTGDYESMPSFITHYRAHKVAWRRRLEANLFATGVYDGRH